MPQLAPDMWFPLFIYVILLMTFMKSNLFFLFNKMIPMTLMKFKTHNKKIWKL